MTRHTHADHIIAAANDTTIVWQSYSNIRGAWIDFTNGDHPLWNHGVQYRQRPAPHPHQAMIDQAKADRSIEWQLKRRGGDWQACDPWRLGDSWAKDTEYRQTPKMVEMRLWAVRDRGLIYSTQHFYHNQAEMVGVCNPHQIICRIEGSKISVEVSQ